MPSAASDAARRRCDREPDGRRGRPPRSSASPAPRAAWRSRAPTRTGPGAARLAQEVIAGAARARPRAGDRRRRGPQPHPPRGRCARGALLRRRAGRLRARHGRPHAPSARPEAEGGRSGGGPRGAARGASATDLKNAAPTASSPSRTCCDGVDAEPDATADLAQRAGRDTRGQRAPATATRAPGLARSARRTRRPSRPRRSFDEYDWRPFIRLIDELEHRLPFVGVRYLVNKVLGPHNCGVDDPRLKRDLINRAVEERPDRDVPRRQRRAIARIP